MFNIITRRTINEYCTKYPEATIALTKWYYEFLNFDFHSHHELKKVYTNASIVGDNRVVFNISGNKYRLIVRINYAYKGVQVKWFGTHKEYDLIDVNTVKYERKVSTSKGNKK